jgi:hypothetical protein
METKHIKQIFLFRKKHNKKNLKKTENEYINFLKILEFLNSKKYASQLLPTCRLPT